MAARVNPARSPLPVPLTIGVRTSTLLESARSFFASLSASSQGGASPLSPELEFAFRKNFLRRVKQHERIAIADKLRKLPKISRDALVAFQKGTWSHTIFREKSWPYFALQAYVDGHLDEMQISKLYLYHRSLEVNGGKAGVHCVVEADGHISREGVDLLLTGLGNSFNATDRIALESVLVSLPPEQTQFFSVRSRLLSPDEFIDLQLKKSKHLIDMANTAFHVMKISLLVIPDKQQKIAQTLLIPPCLWYKILRLKFGANAMEPIPVLGYSSREKFSDPQRRIIGIPCPFVETPKVIHHEIDVSKDAGLFLHDGGYHLYTESANPHRRAWIALALFMREIGHQEKAVALLDRDCPLYAYPHLDEEEIGRRLVTDHEKFWYSLPYLVRRGVEFSEKEREDIVHYILSNEEEWEEQHNLSGAQLADCCRVEGEEELSLFPWLTSYNKMVLQIEAIRWQLRPFFTLEKVKNLVLHYL